MTKSRSEFEWNPTKGRQIVQFVLQIRNGSVPEFEWQPYQGKAQSGHLRHKLGFIAGRSSNDSVTEERPKAATCASN